MADTVEYIKIWGHEDEPTEAGQPGPHKFIAQVNPANIKTTRSINFNTNNRSNAGYDVDQYQGHGSIQMEVSLVISNFDPSDAIRTPKYKHVHEQVDKLLKATYDYIPGSHKSPYVTIAWGEFKFIGHLKDMCIDYKAFETDGVATHANIDLLFVSHVSSLTNAHLQNRNSPDMTHMKLMKEGDKIPLICDEIYDDPNYYIQIAEMNNLTNFRSVQTGNKIIFPPLVN